MEYSYSEILPQNIKEHITDPRNNMMKQDARYILDNSIERNSRLTKGNQAMVIESDCGLPERAGQGNTTGEGTREPPI